MDSVYVVLCHSSNSSYVSGVFKNARDAEKHAHEQRANKRKGDLRDRWWEVSKSPVQ